MKELNQQYSEINNMPYEDYLLLLECIALKNEKQEIEYKRAEQKAKVKNFNS